MSEFQDGHTENVTDTEVELDTTPQPVKKRANIPVPVLAGVTAALLGGVVLFAMQKPKPTEEVIVPTPPVTTPVQPTPTTTPVTTPTPAVTPQKPEPATKTPEKTQKVATVQPTKKAEAKTLTQEEIREKKKAIESARPPEPKVKDPFIPKKNDTVASIPQAPVVNKAPVSSTATSTPSIMTQAIPMPPATQTKSVTIPSTQTVEIQPKTTPPATSIRAPQTTRESDTPIIIRSNPLPQETPPTPIIIPAQSVPQKPAPVVLSEQPSKQQAAPKPKVTITTPKGVPPVIINSTPAPTVVVKPTPAPTQHTEREVVIIAQPTPKPATKVAESKPTTTPKPATKVTESSPVITPTPSNTTPTIPAPISTPTPSAEKLNAAEQWVKDNGVKYGGSASTDGKTVAMLSTNQGDVFVGVGEAIPDTKTTVVKANEKSVTLKVGDATTQVELP